MRYKSGRVTGIRRYLKEYDSSAKVLAALQANGWPVAPGRAIPAETDFVTSLGGVNIHVRAKQKRRMEKRIYAECPECRGWYEAGHLHQHVEARHS